ncbi:sigma factor-like helix-turn-helix DNA-binding protein, partial [Streptomyces lunaelactis]
PTPEPDVLTPDEAFDALYSYAAPALVRQTFLLTGRRRLSYESVERAFHLAWQHWPEVAVDRDPAGWVRAAAYEYAMSPWHRLRRAHSKPDAQSVPGPGGRALLDALLELPPPYRRTLLLYDGLGLDLPETAAETEASTPATANRVLHARAAIAEKLPELGETAVLHDRLTALAREGPAPPMTPAPAVRSGSERRARFWTRAAITVTTLIVSATAFTLVKAPTRYEPPLAPGRPVGGVPVHSGPQALTHRDKQLRQQLRSRLTHGPERLVPQTG